MADSAEEEVELARSRISLLYCGDVPLCAVKLSKQFQYSCGFIPLDFENEDHHQGLVFTFSVGFQLWEAKGFLRALDSLLQHDVAIRYRDPNGVLYLTLDASHSLASSFDARMTLKGHHGNDTPSQPCVRQDGITLCFSNLTVHREKLSIFRELLVAAIRVA